MTITRKNQFEELIDQMMIEEVSGLDQEIRNTLMGLDTDKKRMAILSILDKDRDMFMKIKKMVDSNDVAKAEHIKNVVELMRKYVTVADTAVKNFGEVMTPIYLINDILNTLNESVWSNPELKFLDPCAGVGVFPAVIVERLMDGLSEWEPDQEKRYAHIVENMLHMGELQSKNLFLAIAAFDPKDEYELNIYNGSYLETSFDEHAKNVWGVDKFDVIVMNPPYNDGSSNSGSAHVLWDKFVIKSLEVSLAEGGYLSAVHPDGWRSLGKGFNRVKNLLKSKRMTYLEVHDRTDGVKTFGVQTAYDFYCVQNVDNNEGFKTEIKCVDGSLEFEDISAMEYIPNGMFGVFKKLMPQKGEQTVNLLRSCVYHTQKDYVQNDFSEEFRHPLVYTSLKDGSVKLKYSSTNSKGQFGIPKVIWSNGTSTPIVDGAGEYGITEFSYAIIDEVKNLEIIKKAMLNPEFIKLMSFSQGVKHRYNHTVIATFKKDFYKEFLD